MSGFNVHLQGATQYEQLHNVVSFVAEDASGCFGLMAGHTCFVSSLVFGLSRLRYNDEHWEYLALPGAVVYFDNNQLTISTRRYLRGEDYNQISQLLSEELLQEERNLLAFKQSLEQMERAMMMRLWRIGRGEDGRA